VARVVPRGRTLFLVAVMAFGCARVPRGSSMDELPTPERIELSRVADDAVKAVLAGDLDRLIGYTRPDLRSDQATLRAMRREFEAYLFGEVRRILAAARPLETRIRGMTTGPDGTASAEVVLFNGAAVTEDMVRDPRFLCKHDPKDAVAWTFRRVRGHWESIGYPFDAFTDIHCPPD
jgi:hypothetical protein